MKRSLFIVLGILVGIHWGLAVADQTSPYDMKVSAALNKTTCLVGEPVYLTFAFENTSDDEVEFRSRLNPYADIRMRLFMPDKIPEDYVGVFKSSLYPYYDYKIPPHRTERATFTILYMEDAKDGLVFDKQMKPRLFVTLEAFEANKPRRFRFPLMTIDVKKPKGKDLSALKALRKKSLIYDIHKGYCSPTNLGTFEAFLKKYPDTAYTPYVLYTLAGGVMRGSETQKPDYRRAIILFKDFIHKYPNSPLTDDAVYKIGDCYDHIGDTKKANEWFVKLYNKYPNSNSLNYQDPVLRKYIFPKNKPNAPAGAWMLYPR